MQASRSGSDQQLGAVSLREWGLLHKRQQPRGTGGPNCFECTIAVADLDAVTTAIKTHGGRTIMEKAPVPTVGVLTRFEDTEGNVAGAMAYEQEPRT
jgi:uncharacterized protein